MKRRSVKKRVSALIGALALLGAFTCAVLFWPALSCESDLPIRKAEVATDDSAVVATVAGTPITARMLRKEIIRSGAAAKWSELDEEGRRQVLEGLIKREVLAEAARRAGYEDDPQLKANYTRQLGETFWRAQLQGTSQLVEVSDEEAKAYYREHAEEFAEPTRARGAVIAFYLAPNASTADKKKARKQAKEALEQAAQLPSDEPFFGELAAKYSSDPATARRQGDMGWISEGARVYQFEPKVVDALFSLETPGALSEVIEGARGLYLVRLVERKGGDKRPFERVEPQIRARLRTEKTQELRARLHEQIRKDMEIEIDSEVLEGVGARAEKDTDEQTPPAFPVAVNAPEAPEAKR